MKWQDWLKNWDMTSLKINTPFLEMEWQPQEADKKAAWALYIELLTRVSTQGLAPETGDEETALVSIYALFGITREVLKTHGRECQEFAKIAIVVLNQVIRPFTAHWHKLKMAGAFKDEEKCQQFRKELAELQQQLKNYTKMLADMAGVEDMTEMD